jgi:hypothetical protein
MHDETLNFLWAKQNISLMKELWEKRPTSKQVRCNIKVLATGSSHDNLNFYVKITQPQTLRNISRLCLSLWLYSPLYLCRFFQFLNAIQSRENFLDGGSASCKAATYIQNNTNKEQTHTDIHALSGIPTHNPTVRASEDVSCLRPRGHYDRHFSENSSIPSGGLLLWRVSLPTGIIQSLMCRNVPKKEYEDHYEEFYLLILTSVKILVIMVLNF